MDNSFYSIEELRELGLTEFGENVFISRKSSIYSAANICIGNNVRIDDFSILSGNIRLGNHIHIGAYCALYGKFGIEMDDYSGLSPRCTVFSATDDFGGDYLISPMVPAEHTNVTGGLVKLEKYVQVGAGTAIMPNITLHEGCTVGSMSLVNKSLDSWTIYFGIPARRIKNRKSGLLQKVK
jgi:acetyltransferase-like isoleucine patch superfamily enzyme